MPMRSIKVNRLTVGVVPLVLALSLSAAYGGNAGVDLNIHVGNQPRQAVNSAPIISIDQDVDFVLPAPLGFYVAVGVPYDLFYVQSSYYLYRDGRWFRAPGSHGPWMTMQHRDLPRGLRKHKLERIRSYRNAEYDVYHRERDRYHGKHFKTGKEEWKEHRKAEKEDRKDEKREDKEYRKEQKREDKEYKKDMKRAEKEEKKAEKEERKQHKGGKHDNE